MTPDQIKTEFKAAYDIDEEQILFDEKGNPFFDSDALSSLSIQLAPQIRNIEIDPATIKLDELHVMVPCTAYLEPGITRTTFGTCFFNPEAEQNNKQDPIEVAINTAKARALRSALRAVGFDPVKAHLARKAGKVVALQPRTEEDEATTLRKAIHAIRDEMNLDTETYRRYLVIAAGKPSTQEMPVEDLRLANTYMQGLNEGRKRHLAA